jgi:hypothetical protein
MQRKQTFTRFGYTRAQFALRPTTGSSGILCSLGQSDCRYMKNRWIPMSIISDCFALDISDF